MPKKQVVQVPVFGTIREVVKVADGTSIVSGTDSDPIRPVSLKNIGSAYNVAFPETTDHDHSFRMTLCRGSGDKVKNGYADYIVTINCCAPMDAWFDNVLTAVGTDIDDPEIIRKKIKDDSRHTFEAKINQAGG
jgi:hypothetical protein